MKQRQTWIAWVIVCCVSYQLSAESLRLVVVDGAGALLPCRIHLSDSKDIPQRVAGLPFWRDHFVCPGEAQMDLSPGTYNYTIERGPEYRSVTGSVTMATGKPRSLTVALERIVDMAALGWWSGELHVHRAVEEMPLHLRAEDLHIAPVITWWNGRNLWRDRALPDSTLRKVDGNRFYDVMAGEDEREGGALMYFGLPRPLPLPGGRQEFPEHPSPLDFVRMARQFKGAWIDLEKPFWWDMPVWLASGQIDSIGLANNHMCRSTMYQSEAWGRPRDTVRLPPPQGNGYWTQELYYHVLNSGLRVPPSAGSASGVLPNPVGYNRVYVHLEGDLSYQGWWSGLRAGRSFVTNGPLLMCRANGHLPGHVFRAEDRQEISLRVSLVSDTPVAAVEIVRDGQIAKTMPVVPDGPGRFSAELTFAESGWFLVRAIATPSHIFRFGSTAPYYVEIGATRSRVSRASVRFFMGWLEERERRVAKQLQDPMKRAEVLRHHRQAMRFWQRRWEQANVE